MIKWSAQSEMWRIDERDDICNRPGKPARVFGQANAWEGTGQLASEPELVVAKQDRSDP